MRFVIGGDLLIAGYAMPGMTFQKYLGTEGKVASRLLDQTLQKVLTSKGGHE